MRDPLVGCCVNTVGTSRVCEPNSTQIFHLFTAEWVIGGGTWRSGLCGTLLLASRLWVNTHSLWPSTSFQPQSSYLNSSSPLTRLHSHTGGRSSSELRPCSSFLQRTDIAADSGMKTRSELQHQASQAVLLYKQRGLAAGSHSPQRNTGLGAELWTVSWFQLVSLHNQAATEEHRA